MPPVFRRARVAALLISTGAMAGCLDESLIKQPELTVIPGAPVGWAGTEGTAGIGTTVTDRKSGTSAAYLSSAFQLSTATYSIVQSIRADSYRGQRVRLSGWVKPRNVSAVRISGLFMRVDGPGRTLAYDDMSRRPIFGYGDWRQVSVVLDVPVSAIGITLGVQFSAANTLLVDDIKLEVVGIDVESTSTLNAPINSALDSAATEALYERRADVPSNLDFEGLPSASGETTAWITQNGSVLATVDPTAPPDDLQPLRTMVGSARVIGLGSATYGTKEFQQLKHRMIRDLVATRGVTMVAVEAPAAEAADINRYVLTGVGNPTQLLSRLYSWTTNTQEMLAFVQWMRAWNVAAPADQQVAFRGIDMQHPGASMDSIAAFVRRVAPEFDADVVAWFSCLGPYRNRGATAGRPRAEYLALSSEARTLCMEALLDAETLVRTRGISAADYQQALYHARLIRQFEAVLSQSSSSAANQVREGYLAENVLRLRGQLSGASRMVIWSHNEHITRQTGSMGASLHTDLGADFVPVGFAFGRGRFNAVLLQTSSTSAAQSFDVQGVPGGSLDEALLSVTSPLLLIDTRRLLSNAAGSAPLRGPIASRTVGITFNPNSELAFFPARLLPRDFDLLVFVRTTTATSLLPFVN